MTTKSEQNERTLLDVAQRLGRVTTGDAVGRGHEGALMNLAAAGYLRCIARGMYRITRAGQERLQDLERIVRAPEGPLVFYAELRVEPDRMVKLEIPTLPPGVYSVRIERVSR